MTEAAAPIPTVPLLARVREEKTSTSAFLEDRTGGHRKKLGQASSQKWQWPSILKKAASKMDNSHLRFKRKDQSVNTKLWDRPMPCPNEPVSKDVLGLFKKTSTDWQNDLVKLDKQVHFLCGGPGATSCVGGWAKNALAGQHPDISKFVIVHVGGVFQNRSKDRRPFYEKRWRRPIGGRPATCNLFMLAAFGRRFGRASAVLLVGGRFVPSGNRTPVARVLCWCLNR